MIRVMIEEPKSIAKAAKEIGVSAVTLKRWLLEGKVKEVSRNRNGWRVFSKSDIERIKGYARGECLAANAVVEESPANYPSANVIQFASQPQHTFQLVSLFSGIGGFELGFEAAGFKSVFQCEIDKFCNEILLKHWPHINKSSNIKELQHETIPDADVWVGGFPCQDLSLARMGQRKGLRGSRSGLFHEFARLVGKKFPRVFVLENVPGLLSSHGGEDFSLLLNSLAKLGYAIGWRTFNSRYFGVPQSRQRVYIVGCYRDWRGPARILFEPECGTGHPASDGPNGTKSLSPFKRVLRDLGGKGPVVQSIAYCLYACSARHTGTDWSRTYVSYPKTGDVRRLTPTECEGIMGFPKDWTVPLPTKAIKEKDITSLRYHALGNAVTPPVAEWIGQRVYAYLAGEENPHLRTKIEEEPKHEKRHIKVPISKRA